MSLIQVRVQIASPTDLREVSVEVDSGLTLTQLLAVLVRDFGVATRAWGFEMNGEEIGPEWTLRELVGRSNARPPLQLVLRAKDVYGEPESETVEFGTGADFDDDEKPRKSKAAPPAPCAAPAPATKGTAVKECSERAPPARYKKKRRAEDAEEEEYQRARAERVATVRYYSRMNPDRMFPLLVILSAKQVEEVVKKAVKQAASEAFQVEEGSHVEIEPVLPGCDCYPPRHTLEVEKKDAVTETFWIVPRVLGRVHGARVLVRQGDRVLADVPLDVKVSKQTLAVACGLLSLAAPYITMGLKSLKLDYESQKADGFPLYQQAGNWIAENLRPEWLGLGFLGLAFLLYLWMRPKRRDVFWDVQSKS